MTLPSSLFVRGKGRKERGQMLALTRIIRALVTDTLMWGIHHSRCVRASHVPVKKSGAGLRCHPSLC